MKRLALAAALLSLAAPAFGQAPSPYPPPQPPGYPPPPPGYPPGPPPGHGAYPGQPRAYRDPTFQRHVGFFLQLDLGLAGQRASWSDPAAGSQKLSGAGGGLSVAIGGAVVENLILAGRLWGYSAFEPDYTVGGMRSSTYGTGLSLGLSGIGLDLTYYLMPANVYVSVTPSFTTVTWEQYGYGVQSDTGPGLRLAIGKEWWVGPHWGVGLNAQLAVARNRPGATAMGGAPGMGNLSSAVLALAFSATYN